MLFRSTKLTKTVDSLTPITADIVDKFDEAEGEEEAAPVAEAAPAVAAAPVATSAVGGTIKLHIGEGKDINIELPTGLAGGAAVAEVPAAAAAAIGGAAPAVGEEKVVRELTRKHFKITEVKRGPETKIEGTTLYIREGIEEEAAATQKLVQKVEIDVITPDNYHVFSNTIMDVQPIACKEDVDMDLGTGVTKVLDGVVMVVSGTTEEGVQIGEFGSSEGYIDENMMWGRPGAVDKGEIMIKRYSD